jgi:hypothetical protein
MVLGWFGGEVPWWLALIALGFVGMVSKAVQDVRRYNNWWADWQAMGSMPQAVPLKPTSKPAVRKRKPSSPWTGVIVAGMSLVIIPMLAAGADESLLGGYALLWLGVAVYLVFKLAVTVRRVRVHKVAGTVSAGAIESSPRPDVVEWVLPPAPSSPSRSDAMRSVPDYCARLLTGGKV